MLCETISFKTYEFNTNSKINKLMKSKLTLMIIVADYK